MKKLDELTAQIKKLQLEKEKLLNETRAQELKSIFEKIKVFGFTAKDFNFGVKEKIVKPKKETTKVPDSEQYKNKPYKSPSFNGGEVYQWTGKRMKDDFKNEILKVGNPEEFDKKYLVK
jgi:hypothetical protein